MNSLLPRVEAIEAIQQDVRTRLRSRIRLLAPRFSGVQPTWIFGIAILALAALRFIDGYLAAR